jgi:Fic family protein
MINQRTKNKIEELHKEYLKLSRANKKALIEITLAELPEMVYNSNAIENSTLTLKDTEKILLENTVPKNSDAREVYEAKNLARVMEILLNEPDKELTLQLILELHKVLLSNIDDDCAGRFRREGEWVRIANHIGANPAFVQKLMNELVENFHNNKEFFLDKIAYFHAEFETIHPFVDGNGRIGRVLINQQLFNAGFPPIIIQNKSKKTDYYSLFTDYRTNSKYGKFTELFALLLQESLNKRISILKSKKIITLSKWAKENKIKPAIALNKAKRQTIPSFRLRGKWMISENFKEQN